MALSQAAILSRTCFLSLFTSAAIDVKKQSPSLLTRLGFPVKVSTRGVMSLLMTVAGEEVLRLIFSVVRTVRGDVMVLGGSADCGAAVVAASVLTTVFFAQNAREFAESLVLVCWAV